MIIEETTCRISTCRTSMIGGKIPTPLYCPAHNEFNKIIVRNKKLKEEFDRNFPITSHGGFIKSRKERNLICEWWLEQIELVVATSN